MKEVIIVPGKRNRITHSLHGLSDNRYSNHRTLITFLIMFILDVIFPNHIRNKDNIYNPLLTIKNT